MQQLTGLDVGDIEALGGCSSAQAPLRETLLWHVRQCKTLHISLATSNQYHAALFCAGKRVIRTFMPEQHQAFFENLPMLMVGVHSPVGVWAMALTGAPGFLHAPTPTTMSITANQTLDPGAVPLCVAGKVLCPDSCPLPSVRLSSPSPSAVQVQRTLCSCITLATSISHVIRSALSHSNISLCLALSTVCCRSVQARPAPGLSWDRFCDSAAQPTERGGAELGWRQAGRRRAAELWQLPKVYPGATR